MSNQDPRIAELEQFAREEGLRLPYPPDYICWLEDRGRIVDLRSGEVFNAIVVLPTTSGQAVAHLLADVAGAVVL